jgi:hypothetical protein
VPANAANMVYFMLPRREFRNSQAGVLMYSLSPVYTNAFLVNINARHRTSNLLNQAQHMTPPSMQLESLQRRHTARTINGDVRPEVKIALTQRSNDAQWRL